MLANFEKTGEMTQDVAARLERLGMGMVLGLALHDADGKRYDQLHVSDNGLRMILNLRVLPSDDYACGVVFTVVRPANNVAERVHVTLNVAAVFATANELVATIVDWFHNSELLAWQGYTNELMDSVNWG